MSISVSRNAAKHFLLCHQLLLPPGQIHGIQGIEKVFNYLRCIQYDPLNPCGRNTDLVLQARISDIHPNDYYSWLYTEGKGIECYDKVLCIIPIEDYPLTSHNRERHRNHPWVQSFMKKHKKDIAMIMGRFEKEGPLTSSDFNDSRQIKQYWFSSARLVRVIIEQLWESGFLTVVKRANGKKYYSIPHIAYGKNHTYINDTISAVNTEHISRRINMVGMLPRSGVAWNGMGDMHTRKKIIDQMVKSEELIEVTVEGINHPFYINTADKDSLHERQRIPSRMVFMAPLDNLIWDRAMIKELFDFDYTWEVYVPQKLRKYGYYTLPILYKDSFIGRIEPVLTKEKILEVRGLWTEPGFSWDTKSITAFHKTLETFAMYLRAQHVVWKKGIKIP